MRKQTKLVAVLSAAALLALGASMTSFAAGWEKDEAGIWHYYDSSDDMVTGEWKKDGGKWFYLDDDGDMLTDSWVDDDYYVGSDGAMYVNQWYKGFGDDDEQDDPEDDGEHWYYFGSKGKKTEGKKKIGGKTYYFNDDGQMRYGWYQRGDEEVYYLGDEDEGWRAENQWLWLEKSPIANEGDTDFNQIVLGCEEDDDCDEEGWYRFGNNGKLVLSKDKKKINGRYFMFNEHGQMLYEWIENGTAKLGSWAQLDGIATPETATIGDMLYYLPNGSDSVDGSRPTGWFEIDGSEDVNGENADTKWYYVKDGKAKHADMSATDANRLTDEGKPVYVKREKINGKYFAFNEKGEMLDGLQLIKGNTYYFNSDGYQQTGKVASVEEENDDTFTYYFSTKNAGNGKGQCGPKDGYLYWMGKRLEADDDYKVYTFDGNQFYLVNTKGKIQKSTSRKYNVEAPSSFAGNTEDMKFDFNKTSNTIKSITSEGHTGYDLKEIAEVPHIALKDNWIVATGEASFTVKAKDFCDSYITLENLK
jgi:glucan-binding YG repeat protein